MDETGTQVVNVYVGRLQGDLMQAVEESFPARIYKVSEVKDLALLKLEKLPPGMKALPVIDLPGRPPRPAEECVAIGRPKSAMLWTVRGGHVAGIGTWPREEIQNAVGLMVLTGQDREDLKKVMAKIPPRKVLISDCAVNYGDSGGPLVNSEGKLIGVTFAIPAKDETNSVGLAYHIHLDEVRSFLSEPPHKAGTVRTGPLAQGCLSQTPRPGQ